MSFQCKLETGAAAISCASTFDTREKAERFAGWARAKGKAVTDLQILETGEKEGFACTAVQDGQVIATAHAPETEPEVEYLLTEGQALFICLAAFSDENAGRGAKDICHDMVKIVMAWRRGKLLPRWEVPALMGLYKDFETPDVGPPPKWLKK